MIALRALGIGKAGLSALVGIVGRYPLQCAIVALLCLSGWQAWRISVVKQSLTTAIIARAADRSTYARAQAEAQAKAIAQREAIERHYKDNANEAEQAYQAGMSDADRRLAAYVGRMRAKTACVPSSGSIAAADDHGAGVSESTAPAAIMVSESDLRACNGAAVYARAAFEWVGTLAEAPDSNRTR